MTVFLAFPRCEVKDGETMLWCDALSVTVGVLDVAALAVTVAYYLFLKGLCECLRRNVLRGLKRLSKEPKPERQSALRKRTFESVDPERKIVANPFGDVESSDAIAAPRAEATMELVKLRTNPMRARE